MVTQTVSQIPPVKHNRVPMSAIRAIAAHIARRFDPQEIILFGSHAYGKPTNWSDVDLLVVMDTPKGEMKTILDIARSLPDHDFQVDIVVRSRAVLEKRMQLGDWFLREITQKGIVLYERPDKRMGG